MTRSSDDYLPTKQIMILGLSMLLLACTRTGACGAETNGPAFNVHALLQGLHKHPWKGPWIIASPTLWNFNFTEPMKKILEIGPSAQDELIEALGDREILDQVIILLGGLGDERAVPRIIDAMVEKENLSKVPNSSRIDLCANLALTNITVADVVWHHGGGSPGPDRTGGDPKRAWQEWWKQNGKNFKVARIQASSRRYSNYPNYGIYRHE